MLNYLCDLSALQIVLTGRRKFFYLADVESQVGMLAGAAESGALCAAGWPAGPMQAVRQAGQHWGWATQ